MSSIKDFTNSFRVTSVTIAEGESISSAINLEGTSLLGIFIPSEFTGTVMTFQASDLVDGPFVDVKDTFNSELSIAVTAGTYRKVEPMEFISLQVVKIRSGVSASPVNQDSEITLKLVLGKII